MSGAFRPETIGYFGKLPAKGDFVRAGLPEAFCAAWDGFCREILHEARGALAENFEPVWMESPIWRFLVPAGIFGPAVLGVWLPSVDRVGRIFPFTAFALAGSSVDLDAGAAWADLAEAVGLAGVVEDAPHEDFLARLTAPVDDAAPLTPGWWTAGSALVAACHLAFERPPASRLLRDENISDSAVRGQPETSDSETWT
jgi:type VI secretion system protein ImpM